MKTYTNRSFPSRVAGLLLGAFVAAAPAFATDASNERSASTPQVAERIPAYQPRFGRTRPLIAVVGENGGTELTDFVIPYGVLRRSGAADVMSVATQPGILKLRPALQVQPDLSTAEFDSRHPEGADYVVVPAVTNSDDPKLLAWITAQAAKGATTVSICDGALVVAKAGLLSGRRATAHWATQNLRREKFPDTQWQTNVRYVADGKFVSSAGISASIPTSIALVEAIAGHARAASLARELGVTDWGTQHDSDSFHFGPRAYAMYGAAIVGGWFAAPESVGIPVSPAADEIAVALTADIYSRTYRKVRAETVAATAEPVRSLAGLMLLPDRVAGQPGGPSRMLSIPAGPRSMQVLDEMLDRVSNDYGRSAAASAAYDLEYARKR
jgi:putative intracellular protease/amidase